MRIAAARRADARRIAELMAASPLLRRYGVTREAARSSVAEALRHGDVLLVGWDDRDVAGLAWIVPTRALDRSAYLRLLLVVAGRRSGGAGSALLDRAEREARARGMRHLVLLVTTTNRRARSFYTRHGYRLVGDAPDFVRPGIDEALYLKTFPATASAKSRSLRAKPAGRSARRQADVVSVRGKRREGAGHVS